MVLVLRVATAKLEKKMGGRLFERRAARSGLGLGLRVREFRCLGFRVFGLRL